jgi:superfamily I DNA/RNA helicase
MDQLNEEQKIAATHPEGSPALLLAGAGSGKTKTLTERIAWLIGEGVPSRRILALTFTNKAAREIEERVLHRTGLSKDRAPWLTTIHSLALGFIRRNPTGFGLGEKITPLSEYDQTDLVKGIVERMGDKAPDSNAYKIRDKIEYHRARGIGFAVDYTEEVHQAALVAHSGYHAMDKAELQVWSSYEKEKTANNTIDFSDMIWLVIRRAKDDPEWIAKVQQVFLHVLMDESQDTNYPAWQFVNLLLGPENQNLYVVGDVSQSIYGFNGAAPHLIIEYSKSWRATTPTVYRLARNHRSTSAIVNLANAIQSKMTETLPLKMESFRGMKGETGRCALIRRYEPRDLAYRIAEIIAEGGKLGAKYSDYAILVRSASQIRDLEGELIRRRIPYVVRGGNGLLQTEEVRDVLAYLRLASNPNDFTALSRVAGVPKRGIGPVALEEIRIMARRVTGGDLVKACVAAGGKITTLGDTMRNVTANIDNPVKALDYILRAIDYKGYLEKKYAKEPERVDTKLENLQRLREMVITLAGDSEGSTEDLIFHLTMDRSEVKDERGAVTISTIHSAKGLEWPVVTIFNCVEGILPHQFARNSTELEEERRLWYVAVTRARDTCYISFCDRTQIGRNWTDATPSRFLSELELV